MSYPDLRDPVGRVRALGTVEGVSFIASLVPFGPFLIDRFLAKSAPFGNAPD